MNLAFSQVFPIDKKMIGGTKTNFVAKILSNFGSIEIIPFYDHYVNNHLQTEAERMEFDNVIMNEPSKIHTIRKSIGRWKEGTKIHFQIWTGKPYKDPAFNFAPLLLCTGTEHFTINYIDGKPSVYVDFLRLNEEEITELAINDGFNNKEEFFAYFNEDFEGELVHWTNKRYFDGDKLANRIGEAIAEGLGGKIVVYADGETAQEKQIKKELKDLGITTIDDIPVKYEVVRPGRKCDCWLKNDNCKCEE